MDFGRAGGCRVPAPVITAPQRPRRLNKTGSGTIVRPSPANLPDLRRLRGGSLLRGHQLGDQLQIVELSRRPRPPPPLSQELARKLSLRVPTNLFLSLTSHPTSPFTDVVRVIAVAAKGCHAPCLYVHAEYRGRTVIEPNQPTTKLMHRRFFHFDRASTQLHGLKTTYSGVKMRK